MMYACRFNKKDSLKLLMFDRYQKNMTNKETNNLKIVTNHQNKQGQSAIFVAAMYNSVECVEWLLRCPHINVNLQTIDVKYCCMAMFCIDNCVTSNILKYKILKFVFTHNSKHNDNA